MPKTPAYAPRPSTIDAGKAEICNSLRRQAHERLDALMDQMEAGQEYGKAGVEVEFEHGVVKYVRRILSGVDRSA